MKQKIVTLLTVLLATLQITSCAQTQWKSHATLPPLAKQDCPLWLQYD